MRARTGLWLLLPALTAAAHEGPFEAAWVQPMAPIIIRGAILPLGFTHGMGSSADFALEMTPYWAKHDWEKQTDVCVNGCRDQVFGLITTAGVAFGRPIVSAPDVELDWFAGPKLVAAFATETGTPGDRVRENPFNPGTSYELGAGIDFGVQIHGRRRFGWFAAVVFGAQYTRGFNYGDADAGWAKPPTWPAYMMSEGTTGVRADGWSLLLVPNLNLLRFGFVL